MAAGATGMKRGRKEEGAGTAGKCVCAPDGEGRAYELIFINVKGGWSMRLEEVHGEPTP